MIKQIPNILTGGRLVLSIVFLVMILLEPRLPADRDMSFPSYLDLAFVIFLIAAFTDMADGAMARKLNVTSKFGRMVDPLADKVLICGSFIFFLSWDPLRPFLASWMVLVIVVREFTVHGLRTIAESKGVSFGANIWGKQKTFVQCTTVIWSLVYVIYLRHLAQHSWSEILLQALIWLTIFTTVFSALTYFYKIRKMLRQVTEE